MRPLLAVVLLALFAGACSSSDDSVATTSTTAAPIREAEPVTESYAGSVPAPEFPDGLDWINTASPIRLGDLTGKVVLLDFWTYGCINCIHVIPDLQRLEEEYADELVVIGVHSAKFSNEGATENIRQIVMRYGIDHPVVNDNEFLVWESWQAHAWPTIALVDPAGNVVGTHAGEGVYDVAQPVIESLITEFDAQLDRTPFVLTPESATSANTLLSYPGKVAVGSGTLYVADTGHHRIVAADPATGEITAVYGNGEPGFENGPALEAQFDSPQGLVFDEETQILYVADTNNHAIRSIDIASGEVVTLAGTGSLGWPPASGLLDDARLNSPWGLTLRGDDLWIAMAGFHQIWMADLDGGIITPAVGSSREGVANGDLVSAELAQPSGLAFDDAGRLYFADSESSSIRWADVLDPAGQTGVLSGSDVNLFDYGDVDGIGAQARLQHPLGIVWDSTSDRVIIADTYNSKLKLIDPATGETTSYLGSEQGWADGTSPQFHEPGGLAIDGTMLYVADTNNHVIRLVDLDADTVTTLVLHGIEQFTPPPSHADFTGQIIELAPVTVRSGAGVVQLAIELPDGYKVNEEAPSSLEIHEPGAVVTLDDGQVQPLTGATLPLSLAATFGEGVGTLTADVTLLYCRNDSEGLCIIEQVRFEVPVTVGTGGDDTIFLPYEVELPRIDSTN